MDGSVYVEIVNTFFSIFHAENYSGVVPVGIFVNYLVDILLPNICVTLIISIPFLVFIFLFSIIVRCFK